MQTKRAYRFRFYPTPEQAITLARTFGCVRVVYNHMLSLRSTAWAERQESLGLSHFAVLSTGEKVDAPQIFRKHEVKLAKLQRRLAKKQKGSARRAKAKLKVARLHAKIVDTRRDFLHQLSTRLIHENQVIAVESLSVSNMQKNRCLSKSIGDAGWAEFVRQLEYKARWYGREFVRVDRRYPSSKRCHVCRYVSPELPLSVRHWSCPQCNTDHDRDINAAYNVLAAGLAVLAHGETVRPECMNDDVRRLGSVKWESLSFREGSSQFQLMSQNRTSSSG